jgi:hypothetical protein
MSRSAPEGEHYEFMVVAESLTRTFEAGQVRQPALARAHLAQNPTDRKDDHRIPGYPAMIDHGAAQSLNCCAIVPSAREAIGQ